MLRELDKNLWVVERPLQLAGVPFGARMTVVRLPEAGLWLHSPVALDDPLRRALAELGPVRYVVAPNLFHHLYLAEYPRAYPEAQLWGPPGLAEKKPDMRLSAVLGQAPSPWADALDQVGIEGVPRLNEFEFLHRATRTLIATDLVFNFPRMHGVWPRVFLSLVGAHARLASSRVLRSLVRNREAARRTLETVLAWDFDRVILSHGDVLERDGKAALVEALSWLCGTRGA